MARTILTTALIVLSSVLVGCDQADKSSTELMAVRPEPVPSQVPLFDVATTAETDIVEQVINSRQTYRQGLESLVEYYRQTGNNMKTRWAQKELAELSDVLQYNYIVEAGLAGPDLRATTPIHQANFLYQEALNLEKWAKILVLVVNEDMLREALDKYNQLIKTYPSSDKIDDAAFQAAGIFEYFKDYTIAVLYYQRVYQWDPETIHPAEFKAAYVLDIHMHRRAEALELYQQAIKRGNLSTYYKEFAEERIAALTQSDQSQK
jgi:tetratricopeptide (TPR) repeat protein